MTRVTGPKITEKVWTAQFRQLVKTFGWEAYHTFFSRFSERGFPDFVLYNTAQKRVMFVELKTETGKLSEHQERWRDGLLACGQEFYCWRPSDFDKTAAILRRKENPND